MIPFTVIITRSSLKHWELTSLRSEQDSVALARFILLTVAVSARRKTKAVSRSGDLRGWRDPGDIAEMLDSLGLLSVT